VFVGGFYEKDKERLANIMAYGEDLPPIDMKKILKKARENLQMPPEKDRFDECKLCLNVNCIPGQSQGYFGFGPVGRRLRCRKLFGFRRLQTTIF
jgi:hypothetical protein